ncbi:conserved hypothetical protein [Pyrenophora tritici-repentis Pt-1C-BFP]|uniref:Uncharacterized protein n=1 Tax=Pyrenophora tritici-repentis (strain Pt-1C-BFP) TaxID=426418 RepID=B2WFA6_PYRTR|nr:uncharacterized protein PTRG_08267 [Pyrenophora tritici-repentis Pt-1C-BFP]EDU51186.1 conserved hypothetical protein [Pyrenophora tritici-repentis Pt-1C-BFP]
MTVVKQRREFVSPLPPQSLLVVVARPRCDGAGLASPAHQWLVVAAVKSSVDIGLLALGPGRCALSLQRHVASGQRLCQAPMHGAEMKLADKGSPPVHGENACHSPEAQYVHSSWDPLYLSLLSRDVPAACVAFPSSPRPHSAARVHTLFHPEPLTVLTGYTRSLPFDNLLFLPIAASRSPSTPAHQSHTMNRWLNRKKDGAADDAAAAKKSKKSKKGQEEPKPEFDLNAVLPKADDFRTSLIMPGLSTRFSMLREQDDPSSVIGKASDDSVLQPKRQSRLHEFGFVPGGLSDIAEVSSLNGSIRRPFANERTNSFDSSQTDDGAGSVMTRARPGEGNILFGGRQKIYMISNTNSKGTGRTLYDDDVNMSAYQRLRQEEKERLRQQAEDDEERRSEPSSPTELSRKRETSSSTNSGTVDARTSTTATSIASQGANSVSVTSPTFSPTMSSPDLSRNTTKRRLYDNGLDQQIQDQQSSAMSRLNSIQRARAPTGRSTPPIGQARSATNLNDRFARGPGFRSDSPNALGYPGISRNNSVESSPVLNRAQSPALTSPVISESDEAYTLNAALQPNDRGKATAMGAFNKPKEAFSEEQYAERLRHLQQDREVRETPTTQLQKSPSQKPSLRERAEQQRRKRAESDAKSRERSESPAGHQPASSAFSRFQTAASQMRTTGPGTPTSPPTPPPTQKLPAVPSHGRQSPDDDSKSTFLASPDDSDDEEERVRPPIPTRRYENLPVATGPAPSMFEHPAFRSRTTSDEEVHRSDPAVYSPLSPQDSAHANDSRKPSASSLAGQNEVDVAGLRSKPSRLLQQSEQDAQREHEYRQRSGTDSNRTGRPTGRSGPMSTRSSTRERSSSGTSSGRSRSRTDQYRDDLDQAMTEGSRGAYPANTLPSVSGYSAHSTPPLPTERPSLDSQGRMRSRSNSKTTAANYFESKHLQPIQTNGGAGQNSRSPLQGKFSPGLPVSPRPSPGGFNMSGNGQPQSTSPMPPFSANDTPPVSTPTTPSSTAFNPKTVQPFNKQGPLRKKSVVKSEIGEPVFISTTSVIDTINLPPGASLKNGAEVNAPPVPPINPMRRRFGFGRGEAQSPSSPSPYDPAVQHGMEGLRAPYSEAFRSESSDAVHQAAPKSRLRKTSSEGKSLRGDGPSQSGPSPAMPQNGFTERNNSPPRAINGQPLVQQPMEGGMF